MDSLAGWRLVINSLFKLEVHFLQLRINAWRKRGLFEPMQKYYFKDGKQTCLKTIIRDIITHLIDDISSKH